MPNICIVVVVVVKINCVVSYKPDNGRYQAEAVVLVMDCY